MKRSIQLQHQKELVALSQKKRKWTQQQDLLLRHSLEQIAKNGEYNKIETGGQAVNEDQPNMFPHENLAVTINSNQIKENQQISAWASLQSNNLL